jgi:UDP-N-acetylglucosamine acyltransferase
MARIHPTAIVEAGAQLADDVVVGPYCCIGPEAELAAGVVLGAHVVIAGRTRVGEGTQVHPFASLGQPPQHLGYKGEPTRLEIGRRNIIREYANFNIGTAHGGGVTRVGDDGFFMVGAHIAHDCQVGSRVIMANNATLGGHVTIGDHVVIGGLAAVHQFVRIGAHVMVGGMSATVHDVVPFALAVGNRARLAGLNVVGMKRRGFSRDQIHAVRRAYAALFEGAGTLAERLAAFLKDPGGDGPVQELAAFLQVRGRRPLCQPGAGRADFDDPG